ncbi:MAG TPA: ABC transporter permease [Trueperaceae bacterium]|nr:ABC transporter permease [Trueperaceae bacterium]
MSFEFVFKRFIQLVILMFVIALTVFAVLRLTPGDPVAMMMGQEEGVTQADIERKRVALGLDDPLPVQFGRFMAGLVTGDMGTSLSSNRPVRAMLNERFPATLELTLVALLVSFGLGVPIGVIAAVRQNSWADRAIMGVNFLGLSLPSFWQGIMLILFFSVTLGWLPSLGRISYENTPLRITGLMTIDALLTFNWAAFADALRHLVLPALTAGTAYSAVIARVVRSSMLEVLQQDYIRTARSKGLRYGRIIYVHALRNAMIPMITVAGLEAGSLLSGSVVLETVFSWPGLGRLLVDGIYARDYSLVQSTVIVLCVMYVLISFFVDLCYSVIDPRIRW